MSFSSNFPNLPPLARMSKACSISPAAMPSDAPMASAVFDISSKEAPAACAVPATDGRKASASSRLLPDATRLSSPSTTLSIGTRKSSATCVTRTKAALICSALASALMPIRPMRRSMLAKVFSDV